jgi:hypothetical protein
MEKLIEIWSWLQANLENFLICVGAVLASLGALAEAINMAFPTVDKKSAAQKIAEKLLELSKKVTWVTEKLPSVLKKKKDV